MGTMSFELYSMRERNVGKQQKDGLTTSSYHGQGHNKPLDLIIILTLNVFDGGV
jgi:hypothetical protein